MGSIAQQQVEFFRFTLFIVGCELPIIAMLVTIDHDLSNGIQRSIKQLLALFVSTAMIGVVIAFIGLTINITSVR